MQAVIFCGIQGTGKSTFYLRRFFDTHVRINLDMLRTRHREWQLVRASVEAKQPFVVDNTNPTAAERARYILPASTGRGSDSRSSCGRRGLTSYTVSASRKTGSSRWSP
jgi:hypothetical protein